MTEIIEYNGVKQTCLDCNGFIKRGQNNTMFCECDSWIDSDTRKILKELSKHRSFP